MPARAIKEKSNIILFDEMTSSSAEKIINTIVADFFDMTDFEWLYSITPGIITRRTL